MLNYATVGSNDLERAKAFYDALLIPIGMEKFFDHPSGGRIYGRFGKGAFGVLGAYDGGEASVGNGITIGLQFDTPEELTAFHDRAIELGGTNEGDPGPHGGDASPLHFAYFRDPDGNKLCGYHVVPRGEALTPAMVPSDWRSAGTSPMSSNDTSGAERWREAGRGTGRFRIKSTTPSRARSCPPARACRRVRARPTAWSAASRSRSDDGRPFRSSEPAWLASRSGKAGRRPPRSTGGVARTVSFVDRSPARGYPPGYRPQAQTVAGRSPWRVRATPTEQQPYQEASVHPRGACR